MSVMVRLVSLVYSVYLVYLVSRQTKQTTQTRETRQTSVSSPQHHPARYQEIDQRNRQHNLPAECQQLIKPETGPGCPNEDEQDDEPGHLYDKPHRRR